MTSSSSLPDLAKLSPADRFLHAAGRHGERWHESRPDQHYGECPNCGGNAALGVRDDGSCLFTCFKGKGCPVTDVLDALGLPRWALFSRGNRGPGIDAQSRERQRITDERAAALRNHRALLERLDTGESLPPSALDELAFGLVPDRGLHVPERDARGRVIGSLTVVPKSMRDAVPGPAKRVERGSRRGLVYPAAGITSDLVIVVEGAMTAAAATATGHDAIGLPSAVFNFPARWARSLLRDRRVVFLPDADTAGRSLMERTANVALTAGAAGTLIVDLWPDLGDGRDLADELRETGLAATRNLMQTSIGRTTFDLPNRTRGRPADSLARAEKFLKDHLHDHQWHPTGELFEELPPEISKRTLTRARANLDIESRKLGPRWYVRMKESS